MDEIAKILPNLPLWFSIPIIVVANVVTWWPKIQQAITDLSSERRRYEIERRRLELLKLRYEIEALRREKGLDQLPDASSDEVTLHEPVPPPAAQPPNQPRLGRLKRFAFGMVGAVLPIALNVALFDVGHMWPLGLLLSNVGLLLVVAGFVAVLLPRGIASRTNCCLIGLSVTLALTVLFQAQIHGSPVPASTRG